MRGCRRTSPRRRSHRPCARRGAHIDDEVGGAHHLLVVLDDDDRVAGVAQLLEAPDQPPVVALVQADRRFVEDVEDIHQLRADLRGQPDALALATRQRPRGPRQREVAQPHLHQETESFADLLDDLLGDAPLLGAHPLLDMGDPLRKVGDREGRDLGDILPADAELQRLLLQARAAADGAGAVDKELFAPLLAPLRILVLRAADILGDALPLQELAAARGAELRKIDRQRLRVAVEHGIERLLREARNRVVEREVVAAPQHFQQGEEQVVAVFAQRLDGPLAQRELRSGIIFSRSKTASSPRPLQCGQAPFGELNEKVCGAGSSNAIPVEGTSGAANRSAAVRCRSRRRPSYPCPGASPP